MAEMEKGIKHFKIKTSDCDSDPPKGVKDKIEKSLSEMRARKHEYVPERFVGKGGKGYMLMDWIIHRGKGAPKVSYTFDKVVRLTGTKNEIRLSKKEKLKMKAGGPRFAAMGSGHF